MGNPCLKPQTCAPCRTRKVKCVGGQPCAPCLKSRRPLVCVFEQPRRVKVKIIKLCKREACMPCRRRKRRCDAVRPSCGTCQNFRKEEECVYQTGPPEFPRYPSNRPNRIRDIQPKLLDSFEPDNSRLSSSVAVPISGKPSFDDAYWRDVFMSLPEIRSGVLNPVISPNPFLPLKLEDIDKPSAFALSDVSLDDLNMKFRLLYLSRRLLYGVYLPLVKQQALILGDTSHRVIHPFFIHFAHLVGCQIYQERHGHYGFFHIQAAYLRLALDALGGMKEEEDPFSLAQANFFMALAAGYTQCISSSTRFLKRSVEIIRKNNIRFVPISVGDATQQEPRIFSPVPRFSEEVHEKVAFLAQMLYAEASIYMIGQRAALLGFDFGDNVKSELPPMYSDIYLEVAGGHPKEISFDLEMQFRYELPDAYPVLFDACPMILRVRSMILAKDANNIIAWCHQQATQSVSWLSTCQIFLSHLTSHIAVLAEKIQESEHMDYAESSLCFRYSILISLTNLAQVAHVLATSAAAIASSEAIFRGQRREALRRILAVIGELEPDEFLSLDPVIGIHWSRAISLLMDEKEVSSSATVTASTQLTSSLSLSVDINHHQVPRCDDSDLKTMVSMLAQHTNEFINKRFVPGTFHLCRKLAAQNARSSS